jgi:hypothetical protein
MTTGESVGITTHLWALINVIIYFFNYEVPTLVGTP